MQHVLFGSIQLPHQSGIVLHNATATDALFMTAFSYDANALNVRSGVSENDKLLQQCLPMLPHR